MKPEIKKLLKVVGGLIGSLVLAGLVGAGSIYWWWNVKEHTTFTKTDSATGWDITSYCQEDKSSFWGHVRVTQGRRTVVEDRFPDIRWTADMPQDCRESHYAVEDIVVDKSKRTVTVHFFNPERPAVVITIPSGQPIP